MSGRKLRWIGFGLAATAAMMNPALGHADDSDVGLVMGGSGDPVPGPDYVGAADGLYLNNPLTGLYPDLTFYQATATNPNGNGLFTPEGLYPLTGVHTLPLNYPSDANGLPDISTSVGQGASILQSTVLSDQAADDATTVFGYSQSSTLSGIAMQLLDPNGTPETGALDPQFLLIADPSNPNGGLLERFDGFETTSGQTTVDPLSLPSLGISFDGATPADDFTSNVYTLEYDGFADFPRYPLNFVSDLNAFLGIADLHGTYLNGGIDGSGPTPTDIADALLLPGSADYGAGNPDSLTDYYMIDTLDGNPVTAPLVALLPTQLQELLGPDLTYLINLGYGDGSLGYSDSPADVATPFALSNGVSSTTEFNTLATDTEQGLQNLMTDTDPYAASATASASAGAEAATAIPAATPTFTEIADAFSSALSTAYSVVLPLQDISNALSTSLPAYDLSLFTDNIATGDYTDAFGLPIAANTALDTLAAGFATEVLQDAAGQIAADFSSIGF